MKRELTLLAAAFTGSLVACSNGFSIGDGDASVDAAAEDAPATDANAPDAMVTDANVVDGALDAQTDAEDVDAGPDESCPAPWLVTLVRDADEVELWRLSLAGDGSYRRCLPATAFQIPVDARDAELVDATTAIVAGLNGVTIVNVVSGETLASFPAPEGDFTEVQTFAFGDGARLGAVAWGEGDDDGRLDEYSQLVGYAHDTGEVPLVLPSVGACGRRRRVSSYQGALAAAFFSSCDEIFAFNPLTGDRMDDANLPQEVGGEVFHTLPDGTTAGSDTLTLVLWADEVHRITNVCTGDELEAAPDPSNAMAAFVRCDNQLMRYDFDDEELSTIVGGTVAELGLEVLSLGVAVAL